MKLIVGLGNPGKEYEKTRHNAGFMFVDKLIADLDNSMTMSYEKKFDAEIVRADETIFAKPQTYMNKSGESVQKIMDYYHIGVEDLIVANDDKDLMLGKYKIESERGSAGQKGVQNIIDILGTNEFLRVRIGVLGEKNKSVETSDYVLSEFSGEESKLIGQVISDGCQELLKMI